MRRISQCGHTLIFVIATQYFLRLAGDHCNRLCVHISHSLTKLFKKVHLGHVHRSSCNSGLCSVIRGDGGRGLDTSGMGGMYGGAGSTTDIYDGGSDVIGLVPEVLRKG